MQARCPAWSTCLRRSPHCEATGRALRRSSVPRVRRSNTGWPGTRWTSCCTASIWIARNGRSATSARPCMNAAATCPSRTRSHSDSPSLPPEDSRPASGRMWLAERVVGDASQLAVERCLYSATGGRCLRDRPEDPAGRRLRSSAVMLLDRAQLTAWDWDRDIDQIFSSTLALGPWLSLCDVSPDQIGLLEDEWNDL